MAKAGLMALVDGILELGKVGVVGIAQQRQAQEAAAGQRKRKKESGGCTPCAAKAKGADLANGIWK